MTHLFSPDSMFCFGCGIPLRALMEGPEFNTCSHETKVLWDARAAQESDRQQRLDEQISESRRLDAEPLPPGLTWGDLRRALGVDRWPS